MQIPHKLNTKLGCRNSERDYAVIVSLLWSRTSAFRRRRGLVHVGIPKRKVSHNEPLGTLSTVSTILLIGFSVANRQQITGLD